MNAKGGVLSSVLLLTSLILLLAVPVLQLANGGLNASKQAQLKTQAFYLAEAGLQHGRLAALTRLQELASQVGWDPQTLVGDSPFIVTEPLHPLSTGTYEASARLQHLTGDEYQLVVQARGIPQLAERWAQVTRRRFKVIIRPGHGDGVLDMVLFGGEGFRLTGSSTIEGHVVSNAVLPGSIEMTGTSHITGNLTLGPGADPQRVVSLPGWKTLDSAVEGTVGTLAKERQYPPVTMPALPTLPTKPSLYAGWNPGPTHHIYEDGYFPEIIVKSELQVHVGAGQRHIRVGKLEVSGSGKLSIEGTGKLVLYVEDEIKIAASGMFNGNGQPEQVLIHYYGGKDFSLTGNGVFKGTLQAERADVKIAGSGKMEGHIITGGREVDISGSGTAQVSLVYAPNAEVHIAGSASVDGAIVSDYCSLTGHGLIKYNAGVIEIYEKIVGAKGSVEVVGPGLWSPR